MKRFVVDLMLIAMFVTIGSYMMQRDALSSKEKLDDEVLQFEERILKEEALETNKKTKSLNKIEENRAGKLAQGASEMVVTGIDTSIRVLYEMFDGLFQ